MNEQEINQLTERLYNVSEQATKDFNIEVIPWHRTSESAKNVWREITRQAVNLIGGGWEDTAKQFYRNECFYRDICQQIGVMLGEKAFTQDDGGIAGSVLVLRLPQLVAELVVQIRDMQYNSHSHSVYDEICEAPVTNLSFESALRALKSGKAVRRSCWVEGVMLHIRLGASSTPREYCELAPDGVVHRKPQIDMHILDGYGPSDLDCDSLLASDWEIVPPDEAL